MFVQGKLLEFHSWVDTDRRTSTENIFGERINEDERRIKWSIVEIELLQCAFITRDIWNTYSFNVSIAPQHDQIHKNFNGKCWKPLKIYYNIYCKRLGTVNFFELFQLVLNARKKFSFSAIKMRSIFQLRLKKYKTEVIDSSIKVPILIQVFQECFIVSISLLKCLLISLRLQKFVLGIGNGKAAVGGLIV